MKAGLRRFLSKKQRSVSEKLVVVRTGALPAFHTERIKKYLKPLEAQQDKMKFRVFNGFLPWAHLALSNVCMFVRVCVQIKRAL